MSDEMFTNYNNTPSSYVPNNTTEVSLGSVRVKKPLEELDANGNLVCYSWNQGDTINLGFNITGNIQYDDSSAYEDAATYLSGKTMQLNLYNFRYEVIYTATIDASTTPVFTIDKTLSASLVSGIYYCSLTIIDTTNNINTTVFNVTDGKLRVR